MRITIDYKGKEYALDFDGNCFIPRKVYQSENKEGVMTDREQDMGYFKSLGAAMKKIVDTQLGDSDETVTLAEFVERYEAAAAEIKEKLVDCEF